MANEHPDVVRSLLDGSRLEIFPMSGIEERLEFLSHDTQVTVACIAGKGIDATVELCETLKKLQPDRDVIPHLAARMIRDRNHLERVLGRYREIGVNELFVIGGDAPKAIGEYGASAPLLKDIAEIGGGFRIGVGAYPEPHPLIPPHLHVQDLLAKQAYADIMVSQVCFDAGALWRWLCEVRKQGVTLPLKIGVVGSINTVKLLAIAIKIGVGDSLRFLRKSQNIRSALRGLRYVPDALLLELSALPETESEAFQGLHIFSFNQVKETEGWRKNFLLRFSS